MRTTIEICLTIVYETDHAYLVTDDGETEVWIPKSQAKPDCDCGKDDTVTFTMPEWLAIEKGFI